MKELEYLVIAEMIMTVIVLIFEMRFNLHMFQLNGYKNKEHMKWLLKNRSRQRILLVMFIIQTVTAFVKGVVMTAVSMVVLLVVLWYYSYLKGQKAKKKLVYTSRVKRLLGTECVLWILILTAAYFSDHSFLRYFIPGVLIFTVPVFTIFANIVNAPVEQGIKRYYINDAKRMLAAMPELTIIGITGSYGKTSVKYYLSTLLQSRYNVLITPESYNTPMGVVKTIRENLKPTHQIFVCEMGARNVGDIKELCDIVHPGHGIITSLGPQHLETFHSMENIVKTKFELAQAIPAGGMLFLNGNNSLILEEGKKYSGSVYYETDEENHEKAGYTAGNIKVTRHGTEFLAKTPEGETAEFQTRLLGEHNVINVVGAIAAAHKLGISLQELKVPVRRLQPVAHRLQMIERGNVTMIDDAYNSNPAGAKAAIETLSMFEGERILITPGMVELGTEEERYNYEFGKQAVPKCDYIVLVGRKQTEPIARGAKEAGVAENKLYIADHLEDALSFAYSIKTEKHKYILLENDLPDNY